MNDTTRLMRITTGVAAIIASILLIITANMAIAHFGSVFGQSTRTNAILIIAYVIVGTAILSKLFSVLLVANQKTKLMAAGVIITQLALIALEITTMVLWTNMSLTVRVFDYFFMAVSIITIILSTIYLVMLVREPEKHFSYRAA